MDEIAKEISRVEVVPSAKAEYIDKEMQLGREIPDASSDRRATGLSCARNEEAL